MTKEFTYNNTPVLFSLTNQNVFVNATNMAKPFNRYPKDFLKTQYSSDFIKALSVRRKCLTTDLVKVNQGGIPSEQGTWMHEDVAIEFARYLSPDFAIWCNDRIKELLTQGYTKLDSISRKDLAQMLLDAETEKEKALQHAKAIEMHLATQKPKIDFYDSIIESDGLLDLNDTAKLIGLGRNTMCSMLRSRGVFYKETKPYQRYMQLGYFKIKEYQYRNSVGEIGISTQTFVTQKGLSFLNRLMSHATVN